MPESLMQSCIKVANEAPADIKSNLRRSWAAFSQERIDVNKRPESFKGCLFNLCWFHALVLGRRRFGQQGWSRKYSFNQGDLTICADVLTTYLDDNEGIPWEDLRYIFGEIMYGGHITDAWDRRTNNTYLEVIIHEGIFKKMELGKGFPAPSPTELDYEGYRNYIETDMVPEAPPLFGLHPNAEIGYLTVTANTLCDTILQMSGASSGGDGSGDSSSKVQSVMTDLLERLPTDFEMVGINIRAKEFLEGVEGPFIQVVLQEASRMNVLLDFMRKSLIDLGKGLKGQLNMTQAMEDLQICFGLNLVPGRNPFHKCSWESMAWFSKKGLITWFLDLIQRCEQLEGWTEEMVRPFSMWLPGLFNPTAYLTAVMQATSREESLPLDKVTTETHMTQLWSPEECLFHPRDGAFVHGLFIEGARWPQKDEIEETIDIHGVPCGGYIVDSRIKELLPLLPIIYVKAVAVQPQWEASSVGYLRHERAIYEAPIYITTMRGPTYVTLATMETKDPASKWTLAGCAVIFQTDD